MTTGEPVQGTVVCRKCSAEEIMGIDRQTCQGFDEATLRPQVGELRCR